MFDSGCDGCGGVVAGAAAASSGSGGEDIVGISFDVDEGEVATVSMSMVPAVGIPKFDGVSRVGGRKSGVKAEAKSKSD